MPQHWHPAFPEGTRGTSEGLARVMWEGRPGVPATSLLPAYWVQAHGVGTPGHQGGGRLGAHRGSEGWREKEELLRGDEGRPGDGEQPLSPVPLPPPPPRPPGCALCAAAGGSRGRGVARMGVAGEAGGGGGIRASLFASRAVGQESSSAG